MITGAAFDELVADIKAHGQRETIKVFNRQILDGRNRLAACLAAGVPPTFEDIETDDPIAYVISENITRRHLTTAQRAAIAAELANMKEGRPSKTRSNDRVSTKQAAELMGVSVSSVGRANKVMREDPESHEAAKRGEKRLTEKLTELRDIKSASAARRKENRHIDRTDPAWIAQDIGIGVISALRSLAKAIHDAKKKGANIYIAEHERAQLEGDLRHINKAISEALNANTNQ